MENLKNCIISYANDESLEVNYDTHKLEQKTRNRVKKELTQALLDDIKDTLGDVEDVIVTRIEKGIGVAFITPKGLFPLTIELTMKNTTLDLNEEAVMYAEKLEAQAAKRAESQALKAEKAAADAVKREKKRAERAAKEAAKLAKETE